MMLADVPGFARAFRKHDDLTLARFIGRFYILCADSVASHGGRLIKFIGDACHAIFPEHHGSQAVDCVLELQSQTRQLGQEFDIDVDLGVSVHCGKVIEGEYGASGSGQYDIIGRDRLGVVVRVSETWRARLRFGVLGYRCFSHRGIS